MSRKSSSTAGPATATIELAKVVPPHDETAEMAVLASMMLSPAKAAVVASRLQEDDFYRTRHRAIFRALKNLLDRPAPTDIVTVQSELSDANLLDEVGGIEFLTTLFGITPTAANAEYYANIVSEKARRRRLLNLAGDIAHRALDEGAPLNALLAATEADLSALVDSGRVSTLKPVSVEVQATYSMLERAAERRGVVTGVPTGYHELDRLTSGLQKQDFVVIAARPSMGKTSFALELLQHAALRQRISSAFFSLEMSSQSLLVRMMSSRARLDGNRLRQGFIEDDDWSILTQAAAAISEAPIHIDDSSTLSVTDIRSRCRERQRTGDQLGLVVIDYLQQLTDRQLSRDGRQQEVSAISRGLKALARDLDCPVVVLSQLSRRCEQRDDKRPMLSDLRESGAIEQDADLVLFLYRDEVYDKESEDRGLAEVIIGKQRNGPLGTVKLAFLKQYTSFESLERDSSQETVSR